MWYLYITSNQNGRFYTGITTDVKRRFGEHLQGKGGGYTSRNRPIELLYVEEFPDRGKAQQRENQIKRWTRAEKRALITEDRAALPRLSISRD
jgi:predicted GIY-YIG superfamily endonuclease